MTSRPTTDVVHLHRDDNICVAARPLERGVTIATGDHTISLCGPVKLGHKIALVAIPQGMQVVKYGQAIGVTTENVQPGDWVHTHNLSSGDVELDYAPATQIPPAPPTISDRTFAGYRRANGRAGTRNYIAVISTVNCSASVCKFVAERFDRSLLKDYPNVDGVIALKHTSGCGMAYRGLAHEMLNRVLAGTAQHPNIGAYLLIGLGCEQGEMDYLLASQRLVQIGGIPGQDGRGGRAGRGRVVAAGQRRPPRADTRQRIDRGPGVRRFGRELGRHGQSGRGGRRRSDRGLRRHGDSVGDAGNLRRRALADAALDLGCGRRQVARTRPLVALVHGTVRRRG
jgi:altronate dehydratase